MSKIRKSARGKDCQIRIPGHCCFDPATTVLAHAPSSRKGMALKSPDFIGAYACHICHDIVDGRRNIGVARDRIKLWHLEAVIESQIIMADEDLIRV